MQAREPARKPIYRDLLKHGITDKELTSFLGNLFMPSFTDELIKGGDPVNEPILHYGYYYHTALSYATHIGDEKIVSALLKIGAHPNVYDEDHTNGVALLIALQKNQMGIFNLFLTVSDLDIYVPHSSVGPTPVGSAFDLARGNTATIFRLLKADEQFTLCSDDEIEAMATAIGTSDKPNFAVCQSLATIRTKEQERERIIMEECKIAPPLKSIVLSYLFNPPRSLEKFQAKYGTTGPFKQIMPS